MPNPKVDVAFKKLFGTVKNKDLLISFINSIVSAEDKIQDLVLLNPYNGRKLDELSLLDIKATGKTGKLYNIKMQIMDHADYDKHALHYWSKLYNEQLKKSTDYSTLYKAIGIHILNFGSIPDKSKYHIFQLNEKGTEVEYFSDIELHTIELNKFDDPDDQGDLLKTLLQKVKSSLDKWIILLAYYDLLAQEQTLPNELNDIYLKKAFDFLEYMSFNKDEEHAYEGRREWIMLKTSVLQKRYADAKLKGIADGRLKVRKEFVIKLLSIGLDVEFISDICRFSVTEIKEIQDINKAEKDYL